MFNIIRKISIFKFKTISQKTNERALEMKQYKVFLRVASLRSVCCVDRLAARGLSGSWCQHLERVVIITNADQKISRIKALILRTGLTI